jgi:pimeloyl-ACP methyl ester carboxylesterase
LAQGALRRRRTFESFDAAYANFASKPPFDALDPRALRAYVEGGLERQDDGTVALKCRPEVESAVYSMGPRHNAFGRAHQVQCPVTVAVGRDASTPMSVGALGERLVGQLPNGRLVTHPELGHFGPLERPEVIAMDIMDALTP